VIRGIEFYKIYAENRKSMRFAKGLYSVVIFLTLMVIYHYQVNRFTLPKPSFAQAIRVPAENLATP
jgi:hypothetical protein